MAKKCVFFGVHQMDSRKGFDDVLFFFAKKNKSQYFMGSEDISTFNTVQKQKMETSFYYCVPQVYINWVRAVCHGSG